MLTIRPMSSGEGYSANYLEQSDYYSEHHKITGQWLGKGAEKLNLKGDVVAEDFEAVRQGLDPVTGEKLRPRLSADRFTKDGKVQSKGRELYDMGFSATKSPSLMGCIGKDKRIFDIHNKAVRDAMAEVERFAQTRVRRNGEKTDRFTRNLVVASYVHDASRDLDPQIHTHNATPNLTFDETEKRWKALQMTQIFKATPYFTEVYRNSLARGLEEAGHEVEWRWDNKHSERVPEIKAISPEFCHKFSRMSHRREEAVAKFTAEHKRKPTHNEETMLLRRVRPEKQNSLSPEEVHAIQLGRCSPEDLAMIADAWRKSYTYVRPVQEPRADVSVQHALDHIFERVSVAKDYEIVEEALRHTRGRASVEQIKAHLRELELKGNVIKHDGEIATKESLRREESMIGMVDEGRGRYEPLNRYRDFTPSDRLSEKQKEAVEFVLNSRDLAINLRGAPGTGKTWTLQDIKRGLEHAERPIIAVAPTKSAEEELKRVGFKNSLTIEGLLQDKDAQLRMFNSVLIIDEAGMVSARQMFELLQLATKCGSRIVFSGDTRQINSVEAGDSLRILEKESDLQFIELTEPQRQDAKRGESVKQYSEAIKAMRESPEKGFDMLEAQGAVHEVPDKDRAAAVAKARREAEEKGDTIVVCPTHAEIANVTEAVRADRRLHNELGDDHRFTRLEPLNWTVAEKRDLENYAPGQMMIFHRPTKDAARHEVFEVLSVRDNAVLIRSQDGNETTVTAKQAKSFAMYTRRDIDVAPGDHLALQGNRRGPDFRATNGEIVKVEQIDEQGRIQLEGGRILPADYQVFNHGYAITAHKSQGKTVDNVIISGNRMDREPFYVATSRGRNSVQIFTNDAEELRDSAGITGARQSATELAARALEAGYDNARNEAWWIDYETGAPTQDASRAQPQQGATRGTDRTERQGRGYEREFTR